MSTLRLTTISNQSGSSSVPSDTVINGSAKAWVNFNGTGTVAIRASFNVSSITDNGTGQYTVNFTTAMLDGNYSAIVSGATYSRVFTATGTPTTSAVSIASTISTTGTYEDNSYYFVAIFR